MKCAMIQFNTKSWLSFAQENGFVRNLQNNAGSETGGLF